MNKNRQVINTRLMERFLMIKVMYVNGCSNTEGCELGNIQFNYPKDLYGPGNSRDGLRKLGMMAHARHMEEHCWPFLLSKKLGVELVNEAIGAASNHRMIRMTLSRVTELLTRYKPDEILVVLGLSECSRYEVYRDGTFDRSVPTNRNNLKRNSWEFQPYIRERTNVLYSQFVIELLDYFKAIAALKYFLDYHKVKYVLTYGYFEQITDWWGEDGVAKLLAEDELRPLFSLLGPDEHWITAPHEKLADPLETFLRNSYEMSFVAYTHNNGFAVGDTNHPLEEGHEAWANYLMERLTSLRFSTTPLM